MQWFRVYHDMVSDPKLHEIARRARVNRGLVIAAWVSILSMASKSEERGRAVGINAVQLGYLIDVKPTAAERILSSIVEQGMMLADGTVRAWSDRQRQSDDVNLRIRRLRASKTKPLENNETHPECNDTKSPRFREDKKESTIVDSPPLPPQPEPVSASPQSAVADVFQTSLPALFDPPAEIQKPPKLPARRVVDADFAEFWAAYPRKVGKGTAEKAWRSAVKIAAMATIVAGLQASVMAWEANGTEPQYIPHPASWLNGKRWEDQPTINRNKRNPNNGFDLVGLLTRIEERNRNDRYDDENEVEFGALPALPWPDDHQAPTSARNGRGH